MKSKKIMYGIQMCLLVMFGILGVKEASNLSGSNVIFASEAKTSKVIESQISGESDEAPAIETQTQESEIVAEITFSAEGGSFPDKGNSSSVVVKLTQEEVEQLESRKFPFARFPVPYKKGYTLVRWYNETTDKKISKQNGSVAIPSSASATSVYKAICKAQWKMDTYSIQYHWNGGSLQNNEKTVEKYNVVSEKIDLPVPYKKGFHFSGWYTNSAFSGNAISSIPQGSAGNVNLYAKWVSASPGKMEIESISGKNKNLTVKIKKAAKAKGYEVAISKKSSFPKKNTVSYKLGSTTKLSINQIAKGTYYVKVRAYAYDDNGKKCYGSYSDIQKAQITSTTKEYKATSTSAKITSAKVQSAEEVKIQATIKKRVKSSDEYYYLVKVNPHKNAAATVLGKVYKGKKITFSLDTEDKVNIISKFAIAIKQKGKLKLISKPVYVSNPEKAATNKMEYVKPASKKGIHGASDPNLGAKNTMCNVNLNDLITTKGKGTAYVYNGKTYYFTNVQQGYVKACNTNNISVTMMVYLTWSDNNRYLIHPSGRNKGKYYYALNTVDEKARETLEAAFAYLGEVFGQKDCYVSNWVLGNEVNSHEMWNHAGNLSLKEYSKSYAQAFQMLSYGVKSTYSNARIFIPLDNAWNIPISKMGWNGKTFLKSFDQALKKESPKTRWNLAYHAYSYPLTATAYGYHQYMTNSDSSPYVGMRNIEVVTKYIKKHYGSKTRIILSEQGYTATLGQEAQAASVLYGYYKAEFNSMIDAYIIRSQYDNAGEIASDGLAMGLSDLKHKHRKAYTIFKYMDTPKSEKYAKQYLKTIGAKKWKSIIPGYNSKKFKKMEQ